MDDTDNELFYVRQIDNDDELWICDDFVSIIFYEFAIDYYFESVLSEKLEIPRIICNGAMGHKTTDKARLQFLKVGHPNFSSKFFSYSREFIFYANCSMWILNVIYKSTIYYVLTHFFENWIAMDREEESSIIFYALCVIFWTICAM